MAGNELATVTTNTTPDSNVTVESDPEEVIYLAKTIYGEARGENAASKEAVAWTIRNRRDANFRGATTIRDVVTARAQFTSWSRRDPNYREIQHPTDTVAWESSLAAARTVYNAPVEADPIEGATHYYSPRAQTQLHHSNPHQYPARPLFSTARSSVHVANPPEVPNDSFQFYRAH